MFCQQVARRLSNSFQKPYPKQVHPRDFVNPVTPNKSVKPFKPFNPVKPVKSVKPVNAINPFNPVKPVKSVNKVNGVNGVNKVNFVAFDGCKDYPEPPSFFVSLSNKRTNSSVLASWHLTSSRPDVLIFHQPTSF